MELSYHPTLAPFGFTLLLFNCTCQRWDTDKGILLLLLLLFLRRGLLLIDLVWLTLGAGIYKCTETSVDPNTDVKDPNVCHGCRLPRSLTTTNSGRKWLCTCHQRAANEMCVVYWVLKCLCERAAGPWWKHTLWMSVRFTDSLSYQ